MYSIEQIKNPHVFLLTNQKNSKKQANIPMSSADLEKWISQNQTFVMHETKETQCMCARW